jgi:hypothetical protein
MRQAGIISGGCDKPEIEDVVGREWIESCHVGPPEKVLAPGGYEMLVSHPADATSPHAGR